MDFSVIDYIFTGLIVILAVRAFLRGFITEFMSMAAIVLGILSSLFFYKNGGEFLRERFMHNIKILPEIAAFIALFIIVFFAIKLIEKILKDVVEGVKLGGLDKFLGILFGIAEGIAVVSFVLFLIKIQPLFDSGALLANSFYAHLLLPFITGREAEIFDSAIFNMQFLSKKV